MFVVRWGKQMERWLMCARDKILADRVAQRLAEATWRRWISSWLPSLPMSFKRDVDEIRRAFPDSAGPDVRRIAEGEEVANHFMFLGAHLGEFEGVNSTGTGSSS